MINLTGKILDSIPDVHVIRDLIWFDGPLLSHLQDDNGNHYLYYWCDCNEKINRWMIIQVQPIAIELLISKTIPLDQIIPFGAIDAVVYFLDTNEKGTIIKIIAVDSKDVPVEYTPDKNSWVTL